LPPFPPLLIVAPPTFPPVAEICPDMVEVLVSERKIAPALNAFGVKNPPLDVTLTSPAVVISGAPDRPILPPLAAAVVVVFTLMDAVFKMALLLSVTFPPFVTTVRTLPEESPGARKVWEPLKATLKGLLEVASPMTVPPGADIVPVPK